MLKVLDWYSIYMSFPLSLYIMKLNVNDVNLLFAENVAFFLALNEQIENNLFFCGEWEAVIFYMKIVADICR